MATVRDIVADVGQAVEFYLSQLGFRLEQQFGPAMAIVRRPEPGSWNRIVLTVADLGEIVNGLRAAGALIRNDIVIGPGGRQILFDDPSGKAIELFEPA